MRAALLNMAMPCALWAVPVTAHADEAPPASDAAAQCVAAMSESQRRRDAGELIAARDSLQSCARDACPEIVHRKCREWLPELRAQIPSIVVSAFDSDGSAVAGARLWIDDVVVAETLDGEPVELDPGRHALRLEARGSIHEQPLDAVLGEQRRAIRFTLPSPEPTIVSPELEMTATPPRAESTTPPTDATPPSQAVTPVAWVGFGVAGLGFSAGTVIGVIVAVEADDVTTRCNGPEGCPQEDIDDATTLAHASTASFVIGGVGAAVGVTALLVSLLSDSEEDAISLHGPGLVGATMRF